MLSLSSQDQYHVFKRIVQLRVYLYFACWTLINIAMDLNASPLPEEDEENFYSHFVNDATPQEETSLETFRQERDERRERLRRDPVDDRQTRVSRHMVHDDGPQWKKLKYDKSRLPPGWLDCPEMGDELFYMIPSKVPLGEAYNNCIPPGKRYSFLQVFKKIRVRGKRIGMVVDLTNTDRYYNHNEFKKEGVKHLKIRCQGRDSVPDNESVNQFVFEVAQFLAQQNSQKESKRCVFVHCTHGHNRTGYMVAHYMIRMHFMSVSEAVQKFAEARPPGIYKSDYIDALYAFYHEPKPEWIMCPSTPEWKRSSDFDLNGEAVPDDDGILDLPNNDNNEKSAIMTNDDVLGDSIPGSQEKHLQRICCEMFASKLVGGPRGSSFNSFPGSHPVSLSREKLQLLRQRYYYATWKADGTRYMLMITYDGCYLIDRRFKFRRVQMRFPCKNPSESGYVLHHYTLLDGEMIIDRVDAQKQARRYLIYDLIAINNVPVIERPFNERWKMIEKEVIEPRNAERRSIESTQKFYYRYDWEPFRVRRKDFWLLSAVTKVLKDFIPKLSHDSDGLIFQGWDDPYVPRTHEGLLKWKYPEMNSVDFLFEVEPDGSEFLYVNERGKKKRMDGNRVVFKDGCDPSSYSGKVIECSWNEEENVWVCMRVRVDKNTPNEFNTYKKVLRSIKDNITEDILLEEIREIICLPMYADRIKQDKKPVPRRK